MPATNDENEGALGSFQKLIRQQPQLTMQAYNGLTMFFHNNTQLFMEAKFTTEEDYKFLHKVARETGSGEQAWRKAGVDHCDDKQHCLLEKRKKRQEQVQKNAERIAGITIILDKGIVSNLKGNHLLDQIKIFKEEGAPNLEVLSVPHVFQVESVGTARIPIGIQSEILEHSTTQIVENLSNLSN